MYAVYLDWVKDKAMCTMCRRNMPFTKQQTVKKIVILQEPGANLISDNRLCRNKYYNTSTIRMHPWKQECQQK